MAHQPARRRVGLDDVHGQLTRGFVDPHHAPVGKVPLDDSPLLGGDLAVQCVGETVERAAFNLRLHVSPVDHRAGVDRRPHRRDGQLAVLTDLDFDDRRDIGDKRPMHGNPQAAAFGQLPPQPAIVATMSMTCRIRPVSIGYSASGLP